MKANVPYRNSKSSNGDMVCAMKTVLLMRHAKSAWDNPTLGDFDRPLAARGRDACPRMAAHMRDAGLTPDCVICSAAVRAVETWTLMAPLFDGDIPMAEDEALFHAGPQGMLAALQASPGDAGKILLIAHSPGMEIIAASLSGPDSDHEASARLRAKFPTAALAVIEFEIDNWCRLGENGGRLSRFVVPRDLA